MEGRKDPGSSTTLQGVLVLLLALLLWLGAGPILSLLYFSWPPSGEGLPGVLQGYITVHIPFLLLFLGLLIGSNLIMKRRLRDILSPRSGFRWRYAAASAAIYLALSILITLTHIGTIRVSNAPLAERLIFILPVLLLTPMQAVSEEIVFRALPARIAYGEELPSSPLMALPFTIIAGLLFLIPHLGNPEVMLSEDALLPMLYYFLWGAMAAYLAMETGGFEAPSAMHAANNLYVALVVNYPGSAMPTEAALIDSTATSSIITLLSAIAAFLIIHAFSAWRGYIREGFRWQGRKTGS